MTSFITGMEIEMTVPEAVNTLSALLLEALDRRSEANSRGFDFFLTLLDPVAPVTAEQKAQLESYTNDLKRAERTVAALELAIQTLQN